MRALTLSLATFLGLAASGAAQAADGLYVASTVGYASLQDRSFDTFGIPGKLVFDQGYSVGAAVGYRMDMFRVELEGNYTATQLDAIEIDQTLFPGLRDDRSKWVDNWSGFVSGYADFNFSDMRPYVGAGVGVWASKLDDAELDGGFETVGSDANLALHGEVGLTFVVSDRFELSPGYRFIWVKDDEAPLQRSRIHSARLTLRYRL